ncbi:MAG: glycosyltransferase family 2 protein [Anaerolineae bacterium]|nr:glycosyltransferase family 2 protein [Anaerolineae bacterium]
MNIRVYRLYDQAVPLQPAEELQPQDQANPALADELALARAGQQGWQLLCPAAFEATWNGGPQPEDIDIRWAGVATDQPAFVQSHLGQGRLTFYPGYQVKTEEAYVVWLRGPVNRPKDGLAPLEQIVDTSLLPCTIVAEWQFTRPHQTIRFAAGEPFATLRLYPKTGLAPVDIEVMTPQDGEAAYEQDFQQMLDDPALHDLFLRLGAVPLQPAPADAGQPTAAPSSWAAQLTDPPPVSCICPTYGRVELLEEAIHSFLQQDYPGQKELIVLNDYAQQTLSFDHPEVRIINLPHRFHSVGEKYKAAVALASHDLIFVWHDDDIYLPHRLSLGVTRCDQNMVFFKADQAWFWNDGQISGPERNVFHGGSCWRRDLFSKVHGYPHLDHRYDLEFEQLCQAEAPGSMRIDPLRPADIYYIYRWSGTGSYHLSALGSEGQAPPQVAAYVEQQAAQGQMPLGQIRLKPHWKNDYSALVRSRLATLPARNGHTPAKPAAAEEEIPFPPPFHVIPPPPPLPAAQADQLFRGDYPLRLSVILPASNESVLLQRTVEQFAATMPANSEIIVVDNGSTDGSADFLVDEPCPNIHLIRTPEALGVAGARNRGLAQAQGEIVVFADAHLDLPERWWQPIACVLNRPEVGVVGPGIGVMGKPEYPVACGQRIAEAKLRVEWLPWKGVDPYPVPTLGGGFMAMRHDTLKQAGAFDAGMPQWGSEDLELCVRYWLLGYEVWLAPAVTVLHYFRKSNPYHVEWGAVTHNLLRVALLHFNQARMTRVVTALKNDANFAPAMAYAVESDVWLKRAEFAARRVRDDDWLFEKFADSCEV